MYDVPPELLAPAGDWEAMRAAVANGADAVYFGLSAFNARHRAANFAIDDLPEVMQFLHAHNVRGYVAFNVLIFSDELPVAVDFVKRIARAGADAVIVQDLGLAKLISRIAPGLPVHGSTQMSLTEARGIEFVHRLGVSRVIVARELSLRDIEKITAATPVPVEVFVHGALCVAYSGQCLTSEAMGGRSANRGQCAQACRLPYELWVDGQMLDLGDKAYLLSPQDLAAYDLIDQLAGLRVAGLKVEGRLKSAHYVAATTQAYRLAIDAAAKHEKFTLPAMHKLDLEQSFSRGFTHGFLDGVNHQQLVHARFPKSRGTRLGTVVGKNQAGVIVELQQRVEVKNGDGLVFDEGHPEQDEQGGRVFGVRPIKPNTVEICFGHGDINLPAVAMGSIVWKTDDPHMRRRLEHSYSRDVVVKRLDIDVIVHAAIGGLLKIELIDTAGHRAAAQWEKPLEVSQKYPATLAMLRQQLDRLGDTPYQLRNVTMADGKPVPPVMIPKSVLNDLRRQAVAELLKQREQAGRYAISDADVLADLKSEISNLKFEISNPQSAIGNRQSAITPRLHVLIRNLNQLQSLLNWTPPAGVDRGLVYCEFEDIRNYPDAVKLAHAHGAQIALATIRIVKPGEEGLLRQVAAAAPDAILIRNLAALELYRQENPAIPLIADYSLNIANELTAGILAENGVQRMVPSYDLTWKQMATMLAGFPAGYFEVVVHQHMPMFHMEHCVFAHALSNGKDFRDCGRPCEKHTVDLKDRSGVAHPLTADVGCRNTVYNGVAQSAAELIGRMQEIGIRDFRVEMLRESSDEAVDLLNRYARVMAGIDTGAAMWKQLRVLNQLGVTRGTLE